MQPTGKVHSPASQTHVVRTLCIYVVAAAAKNNTLRGYGEYMTETGTEKTKLHQ